MKIVPFDLQTPVLNRYPILDVKYGRKFQKLKATKLSYAFQYGLKNVVL